jgi:hypothetical protein
LPSSLAYSQAERQAGTVRIAGAFLQLFYEDTKNLTFRKQRRKYYKNYNTLYLLNFVLITDSRVCARAEKSVILILNTIDHKFV